MVADVIVVFDERADLPFEIDRQIIVVEQNAVLQRLVPARSFSGSAGDTVPRARAACP